MLTITHSRSLRYILASLLLASFSASTLATTSSPWQGPYLGTYLGAGFGNNNISTNAGSITDNSYFTSSADISAVNNAATYNKNPNAFIIGIQAGQNWTWKEMVYGVVADYGSLPFSSSKGVTNATYPDNSDQYSADSSMNTNWLFTFRGRLGYPTVCHWPVLLYATGGMAITQIKVTNSFSDNSSYTGAGGTPTANNQIGWTIGGGIEFAFLNQLSADLEYAYIGMPSTETISSITNTAGSFGISPKSQTSPFLTTGQFHANLLKIALNYHFK